MPGIDNHLSLSIGKETSIQKLLIPTSLAKGVPVEKVEIHEPILAFRDKIMASNGATVSVRFKSNLACCRIAFAALTLFDAAFK